MASVSEILVREFFELHGFLVRQPRKYTPRSSREPEEADLLVLNPRPVEITEALPTLLKGADLAQLRRALVSVKGWHTETFSPARLAQLPEIVRFASPSVLRQAAREFGDNTPLRSILVAPALPANKAAREQSLQFLRQKGVDTVLTFPTILEELLTQVEVNRDYQKSDTLQMLRILRRYGFLKDPQLELFRPRKGRRKAAPEPSGKAN